MERSSTSKRFHSVLLVSAILISSSVSASVSLERTYKADQNLDIGAISAIVAAQDGSWVVSDSETGVVYRLSGDQVTPILKSEANKDFNSSSFSGISLAGEDDFVVSNSGDDRVTLIDAQGASLGAYATSGSELGTVDDPSGVAWSANRRLYVADSGNDRISVFGEDGIFIGIIGIGSESEQGLSEPVQVHVDPEERIYVLERRDGGVISIFSPDGRVLKRLTSAALKSITRNSVSISAITVDGGGVLYFADNSNGRVYQYDWQKDNVLASFGSRGEQRGQFADITGIAVDSDGHLAVADSGNRKIEIYRLEAVSSTALEQKRLPTVGYERDIRVKCTSAYRLEGGDVLCLDSDADRVSTYRASGKESVSFVAQFSDPVAASVEDQNVVILDDEQIRIFRLDGKERYKVGGSGSEDGRLDSPSDVYMRDDRIYVADTGNRRIQVFTSDGIYLTKIVNPEQGESYFGEPVGVVADSSGNLFVMDAEKKVVSVFSPDHDYLYSIGAPKTPEGRSDFSEIYDIEVDTDDVLYILGAGPQSRASIYVYDGPSRTLSFGSVGEQRGAMRRPVSLSVAPARKTVVSVYDSDSRMMLNYEYKQLPSRVGGLKVAGTTSGAKLTWQRAPGGYVSRYKVYASRDRSGPFRYVTDVSGASAEVSHESAFADRFYRISAVSGFSVEGPSSNVREDRFQSGYARFRDLDYAGAIKIFGEAYDKESDNAQVIRYLGMASMELGQLDKAIAYFRELAQIEGHEDDGLSLQVEALVKSEDYIGAKAIVDRIIDSEKTSVDTIVYCGELSLQLGDAIGAVTCLERAIEKEPDNVRAHFLIGQAYIKLGIKDQGMASFSKAVSIDPQNADVHYQSGVAFRQVGDHVKAIESFLKALALNEELQDARLALAEMYLEKEQYDQARNIAIKLAGDRDTLAEGQYMLGMIALATGQQGQALLALNKATRADESNAVAWLALADAYEAADQPEKIGKVLESAVQGDPDSFAAARRLGNYRHGRKDFAAAAEVLAEAVRLRADDFDAQYLLAQSLYEIGAYNSAAGHAKTAARLNKEDIQPLMLQARVSNRQGKNGDAIDRMKLALSMQPDSVEVHTLLGALYVENGVFDLAKQTLDKAAILDPNASRPHLLLGRLFSQRRMFDEAIASLDKAVSLEASAENKLALDTAYADKKAALSFKSNAPTIVMKDLQLEKVFSAAYKQYADKPIGTVSVQNTSVQQYNDLKLTFTIKGYMDFPSTIAIPALNPESTEKIELFAAFNNRVLEIDEDTGVQVEVAINFVRDGRDDAIRVTQPMTIYGKNAIVWGDQNMVGSFVTPKDDLLRDFVRQTINENLPDSDAINKPLLTAMTLFDALGAHGIKYVVDPNSPYADLAETSVDYVQFSRETLKLKSGDCDDLSVLLSAGLENLGIQTAILDVPGHLLMMFDTGLDEGERDLVSLDDDLLVIRDGRVWVPVEATMIGQSFAEAWAEGAQKYHRFSKEGTLTAIQLEQAWQIYRPVTLKPARFDVEVPAKSIVTPLVAREARILLEKSLDRLVRPYRALLEMDAGNVKARMQVAIIYARYGLYDAADREFDAILEQDPDNGAVYNNRGNIFFSRGDYERALENYDYAERLASNDAGIKMNASMAHYKQGDLRMASAKYEEADTIDSSVGTQYAGYIKLLSR